MNGDFESADEILRNKKIEFNDKTLIIIDGFDEVRH